MSGLDRSHGRPESSPTLRPQGVEADDPGETSCERDLLGEMIASTRSARTLDETLASLLLCMASATTGTRACIFLYDPGLERLKLRYVSTQEVPLVDIEGVALGEGLVGQVALTRQPLLVDERARLDPRIQTLPTAGEETVESFMALPLLSRRQCLTGVVALQNNRPQAFSGHRAFFQQAAILMGNSIEQIQLSEELQRRHDMLNTVVALSRAMVTALPLDDLLNSLTWHVRQITGADLCLALLVDQGAGVLSVRSLSSLGTPSPVPAQQLSADRQTLQTLQELSVPEQATALSAYAFARLNPLKHADYKSLFVVPFLREREVLGLLYCYFAIQRNPHQEDQLILQTIALHGSLALNRRLLLDLLNHRQLVKGFFDLLLQEPEGSEDMLRLYGNFLGLDLEHPHCIALVEIGEEVEDERSTGGGTRQERSSLSITTRLVDRLNQALRKAYAGSIICEHENLLTCLIDLTSDPSDLHLKDWLSDQHLQASSECAVRIAIGISNPCQVIGKYRRGFVEAGKALQTGYSINPEGGVVCYNDLRLYHYLTNFGPSELRDYDRAIADLAGYDHSRGRKKERLLETLEAFLECYGNVARTAARLAIHRNTALQRLERIQEIIGIDVLNETIPGLRFDLQLALRLYKLRSNERTLPEIEQEGGRE